MNCNTGSELIMKYFDGNINDIEKVQLKQHLKTCKSCNDEFESLDDIFECMETDSSIEPPEDFESQVMLKVNAYEYERRKKVDSFLMLIYGVTVFMLAALTVIFALKIKDSGIINSFGEMESVKGILWSALYFGYGLFKQISAYLKDMMQEMVYYYLFVVGFITYVILQKAEKNRESVKNS